MSEALTNHPTNFSRPPFNSSIAFTFVLITRHPVVSKHEKITLKVFVCVFLIENSCLNGLKVDRLQDNEKTIKINYFVIKAYLIPL